MKINSNNLFKVLPKVVRWLVVSFDTNGQSVHLQDLDRLIERLEKHRSARGIVSTIALVKETRGCLWNYLAGTPIKKGNGVRLTHDGLPVILGDLIPKFRSSPSPTLLRLVNTILVSTRSLNLGTDYDLEPITALPKKELLDIGAYHARFWADLHIKPVRWVPSALRFKSFHLSTKTGPNVFKRTNAVWNSLSDLLILPDSLKESIKEVGGERLRAHMDRILKADKERGKFMNQFQKIMEACHWLPGNYIRRLSIIKDKELKVRVIAIGDYWSQAALLPLHTWIFRILKRIPQDCTHNQGSYKEKIADWTTFHSVDLTAATDRFPITVIESLLNSHLPNKYVSAWKDIMVGYPFRDPEGKIVSYATGNPMGFYSSWATFALTHHYVMYYCCCNLGIKWSTSKYCLLGDDILIGDDALAMKYKEVILALGVNYSEAKTFTSPHFGEFAKRLFYKGAEVTPFPISGLNEVSSKYYLFVTYIHEQISKEWIPLRGASSCVGSYAGIVRSLPQRVINSLEIKSAIVYGVFKAIRYPQEAGTSLTEVFGLMGYNHIVSNFVALNVLENIAVDIYSQANPFQRADSSMLPPLLGNIKEPDIVEQGEANPLYGPDPFNLLVRSLPFWDISRNIRFNILNLINENTEYSKSGNWPLLLKTIAMPLGKEIYSERSSHTMFKGMNKVSIQLKDRAEILGFYPAAELLRQTPDEVIPGSW